MSAIPYLRACVLAMVFAVPAASSETEDVQVGSDATRIGSGQRVLGGSGLSEDEESGPKTTSENKDEKSGGGGGCSVQVIDVSALGTDSLWKYPSEGTSDGIVFIPPKKLCNWQAEGDSLGRKVKKSRVCSNSLCTGTTMGFDRYPGCLSRTTGKKVLAKFGEGPVFMVLTLKSGTNMYWHIKDPYERNGAPPYPNLAHQTTPAGIRCR